MLRAPVLHCSLLVALLACAPAARGAQEIALQRFATGLDEPTYLLALPGDAALLFVLEKKGRLRALDAAGKPQERDVLDLREQISDVSERGLLGMAFHPRFGAENRHFFLHYSDRRGRTTVSRFELPQPEPGRPWIADPKSEQVIFTLEQPWANHNGGMIEFGPDGYLYLGLGDGGAADDPLGAGQDLGNLLGKILRFDVDGGDPYAIPPSNPFVGVEGARPEIWAWGVRNAWRFCFDPENGDLWIGDVGQNKWEEIHWLPGGHPGGANFGWDLLEGTHDFEPRDGMDRSQLTPPVYEYPHGKPKNHCSVTGGFVYRGQAIPALRGAYFWADVCSNAVGTLRLDDAGKVIEAVDRTEALDPAGRLRSIVSFGRDAAGELYLVSQQGTIWKLVPGDGVAAAD
jgi:glucose/arabinose dehydrogenase